MESSTLKHNPVFSSSLLRVSYLSLSIHGKSLTLRIGAYLDDTYAQTDIADDFIS